MKKLLVLLLVVGFAPSAFAATKIYTANSPHSAGGDRLRLASNLCPTISTTPGALRGVYVLDNNGTGTVTMTDLTVYQPALVAIDTTLVFGPQSFIFIEGDVTSTPNQGQTGLGSCDKNSAVVWGVISGWDVTGGTFCVSSPDTVCNDNGFAHGVTIPPIQPSATYNMGTWAFDATGNFDSVSPYIQRTSNGALSNTQWDLRATLVGGGVPALPLVGLGVLSLGLMTVGARAMIRKK